MKSICPSSSSGWIIQIQHYFIIRLYSVVTSWDWLFIQLEGSTIIPWYCGQRHIYSLSCLQRAELLHAASIHLRTPSLPFPWKKGLSAWVSSKLLAFITIWRSSFCMDDFLEEDTFVVSYWATTSPCCFHHFQKGTITLLHLIRVFINGVFIIEE